MSRENSETRKKILEAASTLLLDSKGQGVKMVDIANAAGVSRQAVYLHFASRAELMIATVRYLDDIRGLDERLKEYREATAGVEIMDAFIEFFGNHIPEIYGVAKALMAARETDEAAAAAWDDRMNSIRNGCRRAIETIEHEGVLSPDWTADEAVDLMWTILSIQNWEKLTMECGWTAEDYVVKMQKLMAKVIIKP